MLTGTMAKLQKASLATAKQPRRSALLVCLHLYLVANVMARTIEERLIAQAAVSPRWLPGGDAFWYHHELSDGGSEFVFVDVLNRIRLGGFGNVEMAKHLERLTKRTTSPESLLEDDPDWTRPSDNLAMKGKWLDEAVASPFADTEVVVRFANRDTRPLILHWMNHAGEPVYYGIIEPGKSMRRSTWAGHVWRLSDKETGDVRRVYAAPTEDGEDAIIIEDSATMEQAEKLQALVRRQRAEFPRVFVRNFNVWVADKDGGEWQVTKNATKDNPYDKDRVYVSPDKQHAVVWQYNPEQEHTVTLVESSPADQLQPKLKPIQYLKPGDRVQVDRPRLFRLDQRSEVPTDDLLFKNPYKITNIGWSNNGKEYRFIFNERGHQNLRIVGMGQDGRVRSLVNESSQTFIDYSSKLYRHLIKGTGELLWTSERDGWNHVYLYDLEKGLLKNQVTKGEWVVNSVEKVDETKRRIYFRGYGMVDGQDPYYAHLARVNFDGSGFKILTEGDGTHTWKWSADERYLIDTWSRVDYPPTTVLRDAETGEKVQTLEESRPTDLGASGWNRPERFAAPGRDGKTMVYGIIVRPSNFDATKKYPVLEDIYAGPHSFFTPKSFSNLTDLRQWADRGYVVVKLDGMGTNWRSKAFHDVCYKKLHDAGFPDRIAWMKAAAETRPFMDLSRVGVQGTSAGGQNAGAAVLFHGDFYKVASADSGCHDNRMDKIWWNEQWMGWPVDEAYRDSSNVVNAALLRGKLMLIVGDLDDNVDPSSTLQFVNALNKADKDYELLFIPGGKHGCGSSKYGQRRRSDFFRRHLLES